MGYGAAAIAVSAAARYVLLYEDEFPLLLFEDVALADPPAPPLAVLLFVFEELPLLDTFAVDSEVLFELLFEALFELEALLADALEFEEEFELALFVFVEGVGVGVGLSTHFVPSHV